MTGSAEGDICLISKWLSHSWVGGPAVPFKCPFHSAGMLCFPNHMSLTYVQMYVCVGVHMYNMHVQSVNIAETHRVYIEKIHKD